MERRGDERFKLRFETRVTVLDDQRRSACGSGFGYIQLRHQRDSPFRLEAGDMVELELADSTLYGNVVYSNPNDSSFRTGIEASRVLLGSTSLSSILQRILLEALPEDRDWSFPTGSFG